MGMRIVWESPPDAPPPAPPPTFWLWPENVATWALWCGVQTQWRVGVAGATGLDYTAVLALLRHRVQGRAAQQQAFDDISAMESVALDEWAAAKA